MKKIIIMTLFFLALCLFTQVFSNFDLNLYAQGFNADQKKNSTKTAILLVKNFDMMLQTEEEKWFSSTLPILIQTSLRGNKYNWLEIVTDTNTFFGVNKFVLNGSILDYVDYLKINLKITSSQNNKLIASRTYKIVSDSTLKYADIMSREIASIISKNISTNEEKGGISVLIFPFVNDIQDSILDSYGDFLTSSLLNEFKKLPIISKVAIETSKVSKDQISEEFNLIFKGTFYSYKDYSLDVSTTMLDAKTGVKIYGVYNHINADDFLDGPKAISDRFENILIVYRYVRDELLSLQDAKDFYEQGQKYIEDIKDPYAKIKAEVMYYKAIEIDTLYIPALKGLGDLAKEDHRYDQAISFYKQILEIDSSNIAVILSLGDIYYYNGQYSLAIQNYEEAANLARTKNQVTAILTAYKKLGELYLANGDYSEAVNYYNQALILDKGDQLIWYDVANAHFIRYADSENKIGDTTDIYEAVNYFLEGKSRFPNDSTFSRNASYLLNYWGKVYYSEYMLHFYDTTSLSRTLVDLAIKKFNEASQITNYDYNLKAENFVYLALLTYSILPDFEKCKEYSSKALQLNPSDEQTNRNINLIFDFAGAYITRKDYEKSINVSELALSFSKSKEDTVTINYYLGANYYEMGLESYKKEDSLNGDKNMRNAEKYFIKALYPGWVTPLIYLQNIKHEYIINFDSSYIYSLQLIKLDPSYKPYLENHIEAAFTATKFREAQDQAEEIITADSISIDNQQLEIYQKLAIRYILLASKLF
ncbi:MAG: tetratricopeptide repeat protein, partial [Ignavibacteriaceae bacterium]|nr:tetratricopeptide repeat protein [Ignavibacteriaceae bacterium]